MKKYKISLCTVCMNRLYQLKETLPKNISDNLEYGSLEFVVLDYNSNDGLEDWIVTHMAEYLKIGVLKYLRTTEPKYFLRSHSKNIVHKHSSGDIVCNVDADNFIGSGFAAYINDVFNRHKDCYLSVDRKKSSPDFYGRICLWKADFWKINGYDEKMVGYGFEDYDLWNRLELIGRNAVYINDQKFLSSLKHDDIERIKNESITKDISAIYVRYLNHAASEFLYLFQNKKFYLGKIVINKLYNSESTDNLFNIKSPEHYNSLLDNIWFEGMWTKTASGIILIDEKKGAIELIKTNNEILSKKKSFGVSEEYLPVKRKSKISELIMFFSQINNRIIMEKNKMDKTFKVNIQGFGVAHLT